MSVKLYKPFLNGTAFMGMLLKRPDGVYGPEYATDPYTDWVTVSDYNAVLSVLKQCVDVIENKVKDDRLGSFPVRWKDLEPIFEAKGFIE
ncbi:MAG: hypothetical protein H7831_16380 [Magnetococcus sp. WYHC-3]